MPDPTLIQEQNLALPVEGQPQTQVEQPQIPEVVDNKNKFRAGLLAAAMLGVPGLALAFGATPEAAIALIIPGTLAGIGARRLPEEVETLAQSVRTGFETAAHNFAENRAERKRLRNEEKLARERARQRNKLENILEKKLPLAAQDLVLEADAEIARVKAETAAKIIDLEKQLARTAAIRSRVNLPETQGENPTRKTLVENMNKWIDSGLSIPVDSLLFKELDNALKPERSNAVRWHESLLEKLYLEAKSQNIPLDPEEDTQFAAWVSDRREKGRQAAQNRPQSGGKHKGRR